MSAVCMSAACTSAVCAGSSGEVTAAAQPVAARAIGTDARAISPARRWFFIRFFLEDPRWAPLRGGSCRRRPCCP